jgi:DNA-binding winged helix-turn-helix (wHTH) protein/tetratricopeptide (TPR) repeat protein
MDLWCTGFDLGEWRVEPRSNRVSRRGEVVRLEPRTMELLVCLASSPGQVLSRRELVDRVWRVEAVADSSLTRTVADLRRVLGDDARDPRYVETASKRGYRLVAEVRAATGGVPVSAAEEPGGEAERPTCVAREAELARLASFVDSALAGRGGVALVSGEAGTGKTVLVRELAWRATVAHDRLVVASASCSAHTGAGDPFAPFRRLLGQLTGDRDTPAATVGLSREQARRLWRLAPVACERVAACGPDLVETLLPGTELLERARVAAPAAAWLDGLARLVERKVSLPPDASLQQGAVIGQCVNVLLSVARQQPLVLVLDDLHWADGGSMSLLFELARSLAGSPLLVVGTYRPEEVGVGRGGDRHPLEPVLHELKRGSGDVTLELPASGDRAFVEELVDSEPNRLGRDFRDALYRRTEGHALFTVETLRMLQDRGMISNDLEGCWVAAEGIDWNSLPGRVEGAVAARIERLPDELRDLLAVASVEGEEFTAEVAARVLGVDTREVVHRLGRELAARHRLVVARGVRALARGRLSVFGFAHVLFQRYLYGALDVVERLHLHGRVGVALEALHGGDIEVVAVQLARHFEEAGDLDRAVRYHALAARHCVHATANQEASDHYTRALELLTGLPASPARDRKELVLQMGVQGPLIQLSGWGTPGVGEAAERADALVGRLGDEGHRVPALMQLAVYESMARDVTRSITLGKRMLALAGEHGSADEVLLAHWVLGWTTAIRGELARARGHLEEVVAAYEPARHHTLAYLTGLDPAIASLAHLSWVTSRMGYLDQAVAHAEKGLDLARRLGHPNSLAFLQAVVVSCLCDRGEVRKGHQRLDEAVETTTAHSLATIPVYIACWRGRLRLAEGDAAAGLELGLRAEVLARAVGHMTFLPYSLALVAASHRALGDAERASAALLDARQHVEAHGARCFEPDLSLVQASILRERGEGEAAEGCLVEALAAARRQEARLWELHAATRLARLWRGRGRRREALELLAPVVQWFAEGLDTAPLVRARALLGELS